MRPLGQTKRHVLLVNGMAKAVGVDLSSASDDGALTQDAYADMVNRCRGCAAPGACETLLRSPDGTDRTPSYCRNADILARLTP
ncbi:MAG: DUF6455 family protein [Pseudomonadota bacterium]